MMFKSIRTKITIAFLAFATILAAVLGTVSYLFLDKTLENHIAHELKIVSDNWSNDLLSYLQEESQEFARLAQNETIEVYSRRFSEGMLAQYFATFREQFPFLAYLDQEGQVVFAMQDGDKIQPSGSYRGNPTFQNALLQPGKAFFRIIPTPAPGDQLHGGPYAEIFYHYQIFGKFIGIIAAKMPFTRINERLEHYHFASSGHIALVARDGSLIAGLKDFHPSEKIMKVELPPLFGLSPMAPVASKAFTHITEKVYLGNFFPGIPAQYTSFTPIPKTNLIVAASFSEKEFLLKLESLRQLLVFVYILALFGGLALAVFIAQNISRPILSLTEATRALKKGQWQAAIPVSTRDEIGSLAQSFRQMQEELQKMIFQRDQEIQERREAQQSLELANSELDQIFNTTAGGMLVIDLNHTILKANAGFLKLVQIPTEAEVLGKKCYDIFPGPGCRTSFCTLNRIGKGTDIIETEVTKQMTDGSPVTCSLTAVPFRNPSGEIIGVIEDFRDISERKAAELHLKQSEERYRQLFDSAPDAICVVDKNGMVTDCNASYLHLHKTDKKAILGKHLSSGTPANVAKVCSELFSQIAQLQTAEDELAYTGENGEDSLYIWRKGTPLVDEQGQFCGALLYDRDITEMREFEKLREDFDRIARHDMKSPLNGIINLPLLIAMQGNLSKEQLRRLKLIEEAGYKILDMINRSLDLYKMEIGSYDFTPQPVNLCRTFDKIGEELFDLHSIKAVGIEISIDGRPVSLEDQFEIIGDDLLIHSMLSNILRNAIEASPPSHPIRINMAKGDDIRIEIRNVGTVPKEIRATFFDKYVTSGKLQGTGLGTYSARLMARTQGGDITMTTSEEDGTTLTIRFPTVSQLESRPQNVIQSGGAGTGSRQHYSIG